jgi:hypothetical protein
LTKTYVGAHSVFYCGQADENGIWGKWKIMWMTGEFHIWPKKNGAHRETEEVKEAVEVLEYTKFIR